MSVSSVGLDPATGLSGWRSSVRQANQDFEQLFQSLQTGDLNAAQQAYANFQQVQAGLTSSAATQTSTAAAPTNPVAADWTALGQALQSGSLTSAQGALGKLQQDAQTVWQSHLQQEAQNAQSVYALMQSVQGAAATSGATPASTQSTITPVQNDLNALSQALQSGDTSSAQKLLAQLEQDLQASGQSYAGHRRHHHHGFSGQNVASYPGTTPSAAALPAAVASTSAANGGGTGVGA